jgi:hypothetical protein
VEHAVKRTPDGLLQAVLGFPVAVLLAWFLELGD